MKLRMYLRGLGLGMIITALILSFSLPKTEKMSDSEVKKRAAELGMVEEGSTLVQAAEPTEPIVEEPITGELPEEDIINVPKEESDSDAENVEVSDIAEDAEITEESEESEIGTEENTEEQSSSNEKEDANVEKTVLEDNVKDAEIESAEEKTSETNVEKEPEEKKKGPVTINIKGGSSSDAVAKLLENNGAVDSASRFDAYLCRNGYDKRIVTGNHVIPNGSSYSEIAKIITSR